MFHCPRLVNHTPKAYRTDHGVQCLFPCSGPLVVISQGYR